MKAMDMKAENQGAQKNHPPLMRRFVIFSVSLFLIILAGGSLTFVFSMRQIIRTNKGNELSQLLEIERIKLETSVNSEIAIVLKMATSPLIQDYFSNPGDPELEALAFREIAAYRKAFSAYSIFWINDIDKIFYADDNEPYVVDPDNPDNYWYRMTLYATEVYNFNINYNPDLNVTKLWINAPVFDNNHKPIGMVGTGIELSAFIDSLYTSYTGNAELYFFNEYGEITGAKDVEPVATKKIIDEEFGLPEITESAKNLGPGETITLDALSGKMAIGTIPSLNWYSVSFLPDSMDDFNTNLTVFFILVIMIIAVLFIIFNVFIYGFLKSLRGTMESLKHAKDEAEEANRSKSNFLATMSHEIRTPMNAIIGITQIQLQSNGLPESYSDALEKIYSSGNSLLGIINDILDMSKIETGRLELNPTEYDTPSLINDAVQLNIVRIGEKPIELMLFVDENLPSRLYGDELRLKQILNNLLSNAIKYTEKGYVKLSVTHTTSNGSVRLRFTIEDSGQGMKIEDQKRLFSEYLRFNAQANRTTEGTGLGLTIVKNLAEMMDGTIAVESEYGKGSKFTVDVKQKAIPCEAIGKEIAEGLHNFTFTHINQIMKQQTVSESMSDGNVLVVDDVEINLYVAEGLLTHYNLNVEKAVSGFAAIEKVKGGKTYDVIFMDHMMPQMDGIETTEKLRAMGYRGAIVALTANAVLGMREMFMEKGFNEFLSKPIDTDKLDEILKNLIPKNKRRINSLEKESV